MTLPELMLERLEGLAPGHGLVLAAVSGGADSVALLRALHAAGTDFAVATVDHALRPESPEDTEFVRQLGAKLEVPVHATRIDVRAIAAERNWNLEDAARRLRYQFLNRTAKQVGATHVLTAHTRDDQIETVLLQLLRGSAHLQGMAARRGRVVRPFLELSRKELLAWLARLGQDFVTDSSNFDLRFQRAWVRHELLPLLLKRVPDVAGRLASLAASQRDQASHLRSQAQPFVAEGRIDALRLAAAPVAVQREALAELLRTAGVAHSFTRLETLRSKLTAKHPFRISVAEDRYARIAYGLVSVVSGGERIVQQQGVTTGSALPAGVTSAVLKYPDLVIRSRRPGDRIRLAGGSKKLSDLLIDRKVPREERDALRVLASGKTVLWVEGVAVAPEVSATGPAPAGADARFMRRALELADAAAAQGELPVGALIVRSGAIISEAHNESEAARDPSAHAELLALRRAAAALGDWRLPDCTLYVTLEPCPMCFGALQQAHLPEVVYAATNLREGALGGVADLNALPWKRQLQVRRGPFAAEAAEQLSAFFAARRTSDSKRNLQ